MYTKDFMMVLVTTPTVETAEKISTMIIYKDLAACVNIMQGVTSVFKWDGKVKREQETLMMVKITKDRFELLEEEILKLHPYKVPEIIAFEITAGNNGYLKWLATGSV